MKEVKITTEFIKLSALLKWIGAVSTGSEAKDLIAGGKVSVNGQVEMQRGKKIFKGNIVEIEGTGAFKIG